MASCGSGAPASSTCGDGALTGAETCDDGNTETEACIYGEQSCEVCDATCSLVAGVTSYCGDGEIAGIEQCDDSNGVAEVCAYGETSCTICDGGCQLVPGLTSYCGDGILDDVEGCDDGNVVTESCAYGLEACTVCSSECAEVAGSTATCGDGEVNGDEECDLGAQNTVTCAYGETSCEVCSVYCSWIPGNTMACGDGVRQEDHGEGCDDLDAPLCEEIGYDPGPTGCTLWCQVDSTTCTVGGVPRVQSFEALTTGFSLPASPTLARTDGDRAVLAYLHASSGSSEVRVSRELAKGEWQTATVAWDGDADRGPSIAAGPGSLLVVAWPGEPASGLGDRALWLGRAVDGITWAHSEVAVDSPRDPAVAVDANGLVTIAYYAFEGTPTGRVLVQEEQGDGTWVQHALTSEGTVGDGLDLILDP
ncbi:MAG: hypothetical protein VX938_09605, partial [Myxococcota bacterium]|nr:hypothetical protein [Myxococcota bacterium]